MWDKDLAGEVLVDVEGLGKRYSRSSASTRRRLSRLAIESMLGFPYRRASALPGDFWALSDVSFSVRRGEALGVIGLNGAGKTTLLRVLAGQSMPDAGAVRLKGRTVSMIDLTSGFRFESTGRSNIYLRGAMLGLKQDEIAAIEPDVVAFSQLGDFIEAPIKTYSSGMILRLAFSIGVAVKPEILIIDEILSVGDFTFRQRCLERIQQLREHSAFILVTHSMEDVIRFTDRTIVLEGGRIGFAGEPKDAVDYYQKREEALMPSMAADARTNFVGPMHANPDAITEVSHDWVNADGDPLPSIPSGAPARLRVRFRLKRPVRRLIIGVPIWTLDGQLLTAFSTEISPLDFAVQPDEAAEIDLEIPSMSLTAGEYVSTTAITDGPEFLYRARNENLRVSVSNARYWGVVSIPHRWSRRPAQGQAAAE